MHDMNCLMYKARSERDLKKEKWCQNYLKLFRNITAKKMDEITSCFTINADILIDQKAAEVAKKQSEQANKNYGNKADPQKNPEITISYTHSDVRYGIWINPSTAKNIAFKKPAEFPDFGFSSEVPRPISNIPLTMRVFWVSYDNLWNYENYFKDMIIGGTFDIACFQLLPLPKNAKSTSFSPLRTSMLTPDFSPRLEDEA